MIDLHSHILPGLDDGARTLEDALDMARAAIADGIEAVAATPHVRDDFPTAPEDMERAVEALRTGLARAGLTLRLLPGGEVSVDRLFLLDPDTLARFGLGGNPRCLLVETPYVGWPLALPNALQALLERGVTPVLAHPERNADVQRDRELLRPLVQAGTACQITAASLDGRLGRQCRATALALVEDGLAHLVASDAHGPDVRGIGLSRAAAAVGDATLARWLTHEVPAAIVGGGALPDRPAAGRRRRRRLFAR